MAADAYQGHASYGAFKNAAANTANVAPADAPGYDPSTVSSTVPGNAARVNHYPRQDGK
jgi:hypothetical protein